MEFVPPRGFHWGFPVPSVFQIAQPHVVLELPQEGSVFTEVFQLHKHLRLGENVTWGLTDYWLQIGMLIGHVNTIKLKGKTWMLAQVKKIIPIISLFHMRFWNNFLDSWSSISCILADFFHARALAFPTIKCLFLKHCQTCKNTGLEIGLIDGLMVWCTRYQAHTSP